MSSFFILSIFFNFLLSIFYSKDVSENIFIINMIDKDMTPGTYIRPVISEKGNLYIITGEEGEGNENRNRYILKFDSSSGDLINFNSYKIKYGFWRGEVVIADDDSEKFIITTFDDKNTDKRTFEIYDMKKKIIIFQFLMCMVIEEL